MKKILNYIIIIVIIAVAFYALTIYWGFDIFKSKQQPTEIEIQTGEYWNQWKKAKNIQLSIASKDKEIEKLKIEKENLMIDLEEVGQNMNDIIEYSMEDINSTGEPKDLYPTQTWEFITY